MIASYFFYAILLTLVLIYFHETRPGLATKNRTQKLSVTLPIYS